MAAEHTKPPRTAQERQAEVRREKLAHVDEQIASGQLVIRQMTTAEQAKWGKRRGSPAANPIQSKRASRAGEAEKPA